MKTGKPILLISLLLLMTNMAFSQNNQDNKKQKKYKPPVTLDSSAVKVYLEYICSVEKDGTVRNRKGEVIGKMFKDGVIKDLEGNIIGRKEKTASEIAKENTIYAY
jgi:hypothetical protein